MYLMHSTYLIHNMSMHAYTKNISLQWQYSSLSWVTNWSSKSLHVSKDQDKYK